MARLDDLFMKIRVLFETAKRNVTERGMHLGDLYQQVAEQVYGQDDWAWINDLYREDDGSLSVIISSNGRVYRAAVGVIEGEVAIGEWQEVEIQYVPRERSAVTVLRQADGTYRWFAITETAVLLRVGEIDSRDLFDDFIANAPTEGYPTLRFFHDSRLDFGDCDWLARDENCLLASGTLRAGEALAEAFVESVERGDVVWGTSNGFMPTAEPELWRMADDVTIPINRKGILREISVLPESKAASWFTAISGTEVTRMRADVAEALRKMFGDEEKADAFIAQVDGTNREITEQGMITRGQQPDMSDAETPPEAPPEASQETPATEPTEETRTTEYELTEDALEALAQRVRESLPEPVDVAPLTAQMEALASALDTNLSALRMRLDALERSEEEKKREWQEDLPSRRNVQVTFRPREQRAATPEGKPSYADVANSTLAALGE